MFQKILITRPEPEGKMLSDRLTKQGVSNHYFPLLHIVPVYPDDPSLAFLETCDTLIFVSKNAVRYGWQHIITSPARDARFAAIGKATADVLHEHTEQTIIAPEIADTEHFLRLPEFQHIEDQRIAIVRGVGGRELLADELRNRGAAVHYLEVYRREAPYAFIPITALNEVDSVLIMSVETWNNFLSCLPKEAEGLWQQKLFLVNSQRIFDAIKEYDAHLNVQLMDGL